MAFQRKFPRLARQLGYSREFFPAEKHKIRIHIPGGLPYEAFDSCGRKLNPWSLMVFFESCRAYSFWPVPGGSKPNDSYLDFHRLLQDNLLFIATTHLNVDRSLYEIESPKHPLIVDCSLDYVGNSSHCLLSTLRHEAMAKPYATCSVQAVFVSRETRKPSRMPDWWRTKYVTADEISSPLRMPSRERPDKNNVTCYGVKVGAGDTDTYQHTNWTSYPRYCLQAATSAVMESTYKRFSENYLKGGVKQLFCSYKQESNMGDNLVVESWEDKHTDDTLHFNVTNEGVGCCDVTAKFFPVQGDIDTTDIVKGKL